MRASNFLWKEAGMNGHIAKPIDMNDLLKK